VHAVTRAEGDGLPCSSLPRVWRTAREGDETFGNGGDILTTHRQAGRPLRQGAGWPLHLISALHKSCAVRIRMRRSISRHGMLTTAKDLAYLGRRLVRMAVEDKRGRAVVNQREFLSGELSWVSAGISRIAAWTCTIVWRLQGQGDADGFDC